MSTIRFNPRPSVRGNDTALAIALDEAFQSTPLCEGRQTARLWDDYRIMFQSTPLCEGRLDGVGSVPAFSPFQSTPLCEGRLGPHPAAADSLLVSIHAPL